MGKKQSFNPEFRSRISISLMTSLRRLRGKGRRGTCRLLRLRRTKFQVQDREVEDEDEAVEAEAEAADEAATGNRGLSTQERTKNFVCSFLENASRKLEKALFRDELGISVTNMTSPKKA